MTQFDYVVVEGPHDTEFIVKILEYFYNFQKIKKYPDLDPYWHKLVPTKFPYNDDLLRRVPVPYFLQKEGYSLAIQSAQGDSGIVNTIEESLSLIDTAILASIGIILDCDYDKTPSERFSEISNLLKIKKIDPPKSMHEISQSTPKIGCYILPNNQHQGTLETILLECARQVYPSLYTGAEKFINEVNLDSAEFVASDKKYFKKPAGKNKAIVGSIVNVLRPSKTIQVSLSDNSWISEKTQNLPEIQAIRLFLANLLNLAVE
ncbi:DUF3226 domain-containing protein [Herpetosiphon llansteffanensis]|uniref:DUF3226 domain-containing protein n=1 Tax=Herpetosiphon llansteffanensis TaxID=2094568 RepID=UPI000D7C697B|nr:DUF3226 domain-containing protein [Herpetosiphon llansteffanensis]